MNCSNKKQSFIICYLSIIISLISGCTLLQSDSDVAQPPFRLVWSTQVDYNRDNCILDSVESIEVDKHGRIFAANDSGCFRIDQHTGSVLWQLNFTNEHSSSEVA